MKKRNLIMVSILTLAIFSGCSQKQDVAQSKLINVNELKQAKENREKHDSLFEKNRKKVLNSLIKEDEIPLKTPDVILRVLSLPYTDKNNVLHSHNYQYVKVADGQWILGDYIDNDLGINNKTFTPLKNKE